MQEIVAFETDEKFWITSDSTGKPRGMSRQLAARTTVSDTFSSRWGEVCCDSCAEKSLKVRWVCNMRRWSGFGKSKAIFRRAHRKMNKRKRRAGGGSRASPACWEVLCPVSLHRECLLPGPKTPPPPKAVAPCAFRAVRPAQEWEYRTTCKIHRYRANFYTWRWFSSLLSTWGLRRSSLRRWLLPAPPSFAGHAAALSHTAPPPPSCACPPGLLSPPPLAHRQDMKHLMLHPPSIRGKRPWRIGSRKINAEWQR